MTHNILSYTSVNMNSPAEFSALLSRIGFTTLLQRNEITTQGLNTMDDLADLSKDELNAVFEENKSSNRRRNVGVQVNLPILACTKLEAIRYEVELRAMCDSPMPLVKIQALDNAEARRLIRQKKQREEGLERSTELPNPDVPKLNRSNWRAVRDAFMELLNRKTGAMGIPLSYVGRTTPAGDYDAPHYTTLNEKLVACVLHQGPKYEADVHDVYSLLCTTFTDTEAEGIAKKHRTSRDAKAA
jgi:hypothetical protein